MVDNQGKAARPLPYPLKEPQDYSIVPVEGTVTNLTPDFFPSDSDERIDVVFNLSLNEFVTIASALDIGSDIGWGTERNSVWWTWIRSLIGIGGTVDCETVEDCIEVALTNSPEFQTAMYNYVNNSGFGNPNKISGTLTKIADKNPSGFNDEEIKELPNCNLDLLWGGIRHGIVDRLDETLQDTLQDISTIPTILGRNTAWLDIVPVLGDIAEAVLNSLSSAAPALLALFESYSSEATKDELACELFGLVCAQCRYPTHEEIYNHFKNYGMPETPEIGSWVLETMTQLLTNPVGVLSKVAYFTLMTWQLGILYIQGRFAGNNGSKAILDMATLGEDWANDNWLQLCDSCQEQFQWVEYDFTQSPHGFHLYPLGGTQPTNGQWVAGQGWKSTLVGTVPRVIISKNIESGWVVRSIGFDYVTATPAPNLAASGITLRVSEGYNTGAAVLNLSTGATYKRSTCGLAGSSGYGNVAMTLSGTGGQSVEGIIITKAFILYNRGQGEGTPVASMAQC